MARSALPNRKDTDFGKGAARALETLDCIEPLYPFNLAGENRIRANAIRDAGYALIASGWTAFDAGRIVRTSATEEARYILEECAVYNVPSPDEFLKRGRRRDNAWSDDRESAFINEIYREMESTGKPFGSAAGDVAVRWGAKADVDLESFVQRAWRIKRKRESNLSADVEEVIDIENMDAQSRVDF